MFSLICNSYKNLLSDQKMGISISRKAISKINLLYWSIPYIVSKVNNLILQAAKSSKLYRKHQKVGIPTVAIVYSVGFTDICCVEE